MAPHSSTPAWKIPWTEEPGRLQSMGSLRVGHDWAISLSLFTFTGEGNGSPLQCFCLENPRDRGAWWAAVYGVAQSRTRLKRLGSSSSRLHWKFKKKKKKDSWESWPSGASPLHLSSPRPLRVDTFSGHTASHTLSASSCLISFSSVTQAGVSASALWTREARSFFVTGCHAHCRIRLPH